MAPRSALPQFLAALYALLIVHASLQPFVGWLPPPDGTTYFLWAQQWPLRVTVSDVIINAVAYAPLGFAATWMGGRDATVGRAAVRAIIGCTLLSLMMESAQMFLPVRRAMRARRSASRIATSASCARRARSAWLARASTRVAT